MAWEPETHALWVAVNERDELGSDLVPDYMTSVRDGAFYGWPYSYYGQHVDERVKPQRPDLVAKAIIRRTTRSDRTRRRSAWCGHHRRRCRRASSTACSSASMDPWNRQPRSGYKVIFVPFAGGHPSGEPIDVLTGLPDAEG